MRILKYIFLLLLLALIGIIVYVATQKGTYEVTKSSLVKAPKSTVFECVNDFRNWETFGSWMSKDNSIRFFYPVKTIGSGGSVAWEKGSDKGTVKTYFTKENVSISQKATFNGSTSVIYWTFKDTVDGTKITLHSKGQMDMLTKITTFFKGGPISILSDVFEKTLRNLNKTLDYEMKTYSIKVNGISQRPSGFCLKQTVSCKIKSLSKNIKIIMPQMIHFFKKNKLEMAGKPFVYYDNYSIGNNFVTFSVCIPTTKQIFVMPNSDVVSGEIVPFTCLKTTLIGDYSHTQEAWRKAKKYISDSNLTENNAGKYSEVYVKTIDNIKQPSKWITEIYIPVFPKTETVQTAVLPTIHQVSPAESTQSNAEMP